MFIRKNFDVWIYVRIFVSNKEYYVNHECTDRNDVEGETEG